MSVSLTQLARFMTSDPAAQIKVVEDAKYPDSDESRAQAKYYRETLDRARLHHNAGKAPAYLPAEAQALRVQAGQSPKRRTRDRLHNNARAIDDYAAHFSTRGFQVLRGKRLALRFHGVEVRVTPDFVVRERGLEKMVKLYCKTAEPTPTYVRIVCQAMFEAAVQAGWPAGQTMTPARVRFLDLHRGADHKGARMGARMSTNIAAACRQISLIWPAV